MSILRRIRPFLILLFLFPIACDSTPPSFDWSRFLASLAFVESGGEKDPNHCVGDGGRSLGKYQISKECFSDAVTFDKTIKDKYEYCTNPEVSERVVKAYLTRYAKEFITKNDYQAVARIWNGGPKGYKKQSTVLYGKKFVAAYEKE